MYDFTISPLTASPYDSSKEANTLRVPGTLVAKRNFALMEVSGTQKERKALFTIYDKDGKEFWHKEIKATELQ